MSTPGTVNEDGRVKFRSDGSVISTMGFPTKSGGSISSNLQAMKEVSSLVKRKTVNMDKRITDELAHQHIQEAFITRDLWNIAEDDLLRLKFKALSQKRNGRGSQGKNMRGQSLFNFAPEPNWFMIDPHSRIRLAWDLTALIFLSFDLIVVPMQAFPLPDILALSIVSYVALAFWSCDIVLLFITGVYTEGRLLMRFHDVALKYMRGFFPLDVLLVGCEYFMIILDSTGDSKSVKAMRVLRSSRFIRVLRFLKLLRFVKVVRILAELDSHVRNDVVMMVISTSRLIVLLLLTAHMAACTWYAFGDEPKGWVYTEQIQDRGLGDRYLYSFQWAMARLHPSNMSENMMLQTFHERILALVMTLVAMLVLSLFISTMTNTMKKIEEHREKHGRKLAVTRKYCRDHKISHQLIHRVKQYMDNHQTRRHSSKYNGQNCEAELMTMLPHSLLMDLRHEAWSPVISRLDFFQGLHKSCRATERDLCHYALDEIAVFKGDTVFTTGDACGRMLFVVQATLTYTRGMVMDFRVSAVDDKEGVDDCDDEEVVLPGRWLSEAALWTPWENYGQLSCTSEGSLLGVMVDAFMDVMRSHENAMIDTCIYAKAFVEVLNETDKDLLTDINTLEEEIARQLSDPQPKNLRATFKEIKEELCDEQVQPILAWELSTG